MSVFSEGDEIFYKGREGLQIFGIVVEIEPEKKVALIRFGDCTEKWSPYKRIRRVGHPFAPASSTSDDDPDPGIYDFDLDLDDDDDDIPLKRLKKRPKRKNEPKLPPPPPKSSRPKLQRKASYQRPERRSRSPTPDRVKEARRSLPYDFESLTWDSAHQRNSQEKYCYCGESGDWYRKMFQCRKCLQWFHQECLRMSSEPILLGDKFFEFTCALCFVSNEESLVRLDLTWTDAVHLVLFNLTVINSKKYHDLQSSVIPFFKRKWKSLQGPAENLKPRKIEPDFLSRLLTSNKSRFKCGSEIKKRSTFWGLRKVAPPGVNPAGATAFGLHYKCKSTPSDSVITLVHNNQGVSDNNKNKQQSAEKDSNGGGSNSASSSSNAKAAPAAKRPRGRPPRSSNGQFEVQ